MFKFKIYDNNLMIASYSNYYVALHELISFAIQNNMYNKIVIELVTNDITLFPIEVDTLFIEINQVKLCVY